MAVTITLAEFMVALQLDASDTEESQNAERILGYCTEAVVHYVATCPDTAHNEAVRRLGGYMRDQPEAGRGDGYSNGFRNSGAARILLPYRLHRAGYADAVGTAQAAVGTTGNPVTNVDIVAGELVVTFFDGSTETHTLPAAGTFGIDQTARNSASAAQLAADTAEAEITAHDASPHNMDSTARAEAVAAQAEADAAAAQGITNLGVITAHTQSQHNHDATARQDAVDAGIEITDHEAATNPHSITIYTDADADARVQAAQGTNVPTNTPGTPDAGDALTWSPDNHDHGFDPGHGGTGDITGIVTESTSGLAGGVNGGEATLILDLSGLDEMNGQYLHRDSDRLYVEYRSDTSNVRRQISLFELVQGLMRATNTAHMRPADNDRFFVMDVSYEGGRHVTSTVVNSYGRDSPRMTP